MVIFIGPDIIEPITIVRIRSLRIFSTLRLALSKQDVLSLNLEHIK